MAQFCMSTCWLCLPFYAPKKQQQVKAQKTNNTDFKTQHGASSEKHWPCILLLRFIRKRLRSPDFDFEIWFDQQWSVIILIVCAPLTHNHPHDVNQVNKTVWQSSLAVFLFLVNEIFLLKGNASSSSDLCVCVLIFILFAIWSVSRGLFAEALWCLVVTQTWFLANEVVAQMSPASEDNPD